MAVVTLKGWLLGDLALILWSRPALAAERCGHTLHSVVTLLLRWSEVQCQFCSTWEAVNVCHLLCDSLDPQGRLKEINAWQEELLRLKKKGQALWNPSLNQDLKPWIRPVTIKPTCDFLQGFHKLGFWSLHGLLCFCLEGDLMFFIGEQSFATNQTWKKMKEQLFWKPALSLMVLGARWELLFPLLPQLQKILSFCYLWVTSVNHCPWTRLNETSASAL